MGELHVHNLAKFNCNIFVETGTGKGNGLAYAEKFNFEKLYSIEVNKQLFKECKLKFSSSRIELLHGLSICGLENILTAVDKDKKILFWLDAHFPGADFQLANYDDPIPSSIKLPLESEINIIYKYRNGCKDSFIIDDLQLFEDGAFELPATPAFLCKYKSSNQFIYDLYKDTHNISKNYKHQGFLILTPKD